MPVSTGQVSFQDIADEFGGTTPHTLSEYYRGNGLVNSSITEIPSSGSPISVGSKSRSNSSSQLLNNATIEKESIKFLYVFLMIY